MIEFSTELGFWSKFTFWYVWINAFMTAGFLVLVIFGGLFDLRFLFRSLRAERADESDDGRVTQQDVDPRDSGDATDAVVKMMIAMAIRRYGFDPERGCNSTVTDIVRDLEYVGLSLSPATISKWLREASACLPDAIDEDGKVQRELQQVKS